MNEPPPTPSCGALVWLFVTLLIGVAYVGWMVFAEGPRTWVVVGLVVLVAVCATLAHRLMAMTRR